MKWQDSAETPGRIARNRFGQTPKLGRVGPKRPAGSFRNGWQDSTETGGRFGAKYSKFTEGDQTKIKFILLGIACGGILIGLLNLAALVASSNATYRLHKWWEDNRPTDYSGPGVVGWSLKPTSRWPHLLVVWNFLPVVICGVWTYILFMGGFW